MNDIKLRFKSDVITNILMTQVIVNESLQNKEMLLYSLPNNVVSYLLLDLSQ